MRKAPSVLALLFIAITLARVAHFADVHMHAGFLGWLFALCMGVSVYVVSSNTREHITVRENAQEDRRSRNARRIARGVLMPLILSEGLFNLADVLSALTPDAPLHIQIAAWVYGLLPTLLVAGLGMLQGYLDRLPVPPHKPDAWQRLSARILARFESALETPKPAPVQTPMPMEPSMLLPAMQTQAKPPMQKRPAPKRKPHAKTHEQGLLAVCTACGWESTKTYAHARQQSNALAAHARFCKVKQNGHVSRETL